MSDFQDALGWLRMAVSSAGLNDPAKWSGWIEQDEKKLRDVQVVGVHVGAQGLALTIVDGEATQVLSAVPSVQHPDRMEVSLNGAVLPNAALVCAPKSSLGEPIRVSFDFRPILLDGAQVRFDMRFTA